MSNCGYGYVIYIYNNLHFQIYFFMKIWDVFKRQPIHEKLYPMKNIEEKFLRDPLAEVQFEYELTIGVCYPWLIHQQCFFTTRTIGWKSIDKC